MASYLSQRGWPWEYERPVGGRKLDFYVDHPDTPFAIEVYEPVMNLGVNGGWVDSYPPLRRMFAGRKRRQLAAAMDAGVPYVVALARTHSDLPFQPPLVAGAMFGNLQITFPVGPDVTADVPTDVRTSFGGSGRVQPGQFRGLSAVALIHGYNPTQIRVKQAINERIGRTKPPPTTTSRESVIRDNAAMFAMVNDMYSHFTLTGEYIERARRTRLTVLHNPFALHPLDMSVFNDSHDVQWHRREVDGVVGYGPAWGCNLPFD